MKICNNCHYVNDDSSLYCSGCGAPLNTYNNNFCSFCGSKLNNDVNFCPSCGNSVNGTNNTTSGGIFSYENVKLHNDRIYNVDKKINKGFFPVFVVLFIIVVILGIVFSILLESPLVFLTVLPLLGSIAFGVIKDNLHNKVRHDVVDYVNEKYKDR